MCFEILNRYVKNGGTARRRFVDIRENIGRGSRLCPSLVHVLMDI